MGRALSLDERARLLKTAAQRPEWQLARLALTISENTTMRSCEIKGLQWRDINLIDRELTVSISKTEGGRFRLIPLNSGAYAAILELRDRAKAWFGSEPLPDWYVFPAGQGKGRRPGRIGPRLNRIRRTLLPRGGLRGEPSAPQPRRATRKRVFPRCQA